MPVAIDHAFDRNWMKMLLQIIPPLQRFFCENKFNRSRWKTRESMQTVKMTREFHKKSMLFHLIVVPDIRQTLSYINAKIFLIFFFYDTIFFRVLIRFRMQKNDIRSCWRAVAKSLLSTGKQTRCSFLWIKYSITNFARPVYDVWNTCWNSVFQ